MSGRVHLLSIEDLSDDVFRRIVRLGAEFEATGIPPDALRGKVVGTLFTATSTRTRTAFAVAAARLGAGVLTYGPHDLQLNTGETAEDTGRVLGEMLDALVVRTAADPGQVRALAANTGMSVVNAMTADEHPTQALADCSTMLAHFGALAGIRVLYLGEGNNTAAALALALARVRGATLMLACPSGYGVDRGLVERARHTAVRYGASILSADDPNVDGAYDVLYTTRWQTTGTTKADPAWQGDFEPFRLDEQVLARYPEAVVMHDLPAHRGQEITTEALEHPGSLVFAQARMKLYSAAAVLYTLIGHR